MVRTVDERGRMEVDRLAGKVGGRGMSGMDAGR